jgi:outer membrane beta-barrel protein
MLSGIPSCGRAVARTAWVLMLPVGLALAADPARCDDPPANASGQPSDEEALMTPALETSAEVGEPAEPSAEVGRPVETSGDVTLPVETPGEVETKVILDRGETSVVRSGPGFNYAIVGVYPSGAIFTVIAKRDEWYNIRLTETQTAWIHGSLCREFDDLSGLEYRPNRRLFSRIGSFTLTTAVGGYAFDQKSNSLTFGARVGYYVFDRVTFEGGLSWTKVNRPEEIVESLFGLRLEAERFDMLAYEMNVGFDVLPGRQIAPYLSGGIGSSIFEGRTEPSVNVGGGAIVFVGKNLGLRWDVRNYRFDSGAGNARRGNNNISVTLGTTFIL